LIVNLVIWCYWSMFISMSNLILLTFFYVLFNKFSNIFHYLYDLFFCRSLNSFSSNNVFWWWKIKTHSRFEFVISQKRWYLSKCKNECIQNVFNHWQSICSIILLMIYVCAKITLHFLIEDFTLIVCFEIKDCRKFRFDFEYFANDVSY
jgi:uncharacterized membrane protein YbhN (UPF0104 family)